MKRSVLGLRIRLFFFLVVTTIEGSTTFAAQLSPIAHTGLMQQPASQYYHLVSGATIDLQFWKSWSLRGTYLERPVFRHAGYVDQDLFAYGQTGASFLQKGAFEIYGYVGVGKCWGYIKIDEANTAALADNAAGETRNDYSLTATAFSMEGVASSKYLDFRIGHSLIVGKGQGDIFQSKVAWPFTVYYIGISTPVSFGREKRP